MWEVHEVFGYGGWMFLWAVGGLVLFIALIYGASRAGAGSCCACRHESSPSTCDHHDRCSEQDDRP